LKHNFRYLQLDISFEIDNLISRIVQKAIFLVLEAIYESSSYSNSNSYDKKNKYECVLKKAENSFKKANWIVKIGIPKLFKNIDYSSLIHLLQEKIYCNKTMDLFRGSLCCNYISNTTALKSKFEILCDSILCKIYLNKLGTYITNYKRTFDSTINPHLNDIKLNRVVDKLQKKVTSNKSKIKSKKSFNIEKLKQLTTIGHYDEYFIGIIGSYDDALYLKKKVEIYCKNVLNIKLNLEKTKLISFNKHKISFFHYNIQKTDQLQKIRKSIKTFRLISYAPIKKIFNELNLKGYLKKRKKRLVSTKVSNLVNLSHENIIKHYNKLIRDLLNHYSFVKNRKNLISITHAFKMSAARTLALKYK